MPIYKNAHLFSLGNWPYGFCGDKKGYFLPVTVLFTITPNLKETTFCPECLESEECGLALLAEMDK